jgi:protein-S-isoprenylcysteine O-methyltransferase Ste14
MIKKNDTMMALGRVIFTFPAVIFFVLVMPFIIIKLSPKITSLYSCKLLLGNLNYFIGGILIIIGLTLSLRTVYVQIKRGLGTPIPMLPPEKLLMNGPYRYCRNPMALGGYIYYFGISCFDRSLSSFFIVILFVIILSIIIKIGEEPELEKRFGQAYTEYKRETPFMIPKISGKRWYFLFLK